MLIYGWHDNQSTPIQPVYSGHIASYADYSHGVRLISKQAYLNGKPVEIETILKDSSLWMLLSDEGQIEQAFYPER